MPGVVGIFGAVDLEFASATARPQLASDVVLFVGDAIAVAVAETRAQAVDAAAAVIVDYDPLPVVGDSVKALEPNASLVQADREDNLIVDFEVGEPGALDGAAGSITARVVKHRRGAAAQVQDVALGATRDGKLVGLDLEIVADCGADAGLGAALPGYTMLMSSGVYDIPKIRVRSRTALTNTTIVSAYRGAGRPEAIAMIDRAMDMLAAELGLDPAELRRRNFIRGEFPFTTAAGATYDSGDYPRALDVALEAVGYDGLRL